MIVNKLFVKSALCCLALTMATACTNNSPSEDAKEHAEEVNEENLSREGEKDADLMADIYCLNLFEIQASETAKMKASTAEVKQIASMMIDAHSKMNTDLMQLASNKNITLPANMTTEQMDEAEKLNEKTGLDYDKEYLDKMQNKHKDAIDKLERTANKGEDADVRAMASKALPEVRSHLDMIENAREKVKDVKKDNDKVAGKDGAHDGGNH